MASVQALNNWSVYIIQCSDGSLYTGITTDITRRYQQHTAQLGTHYFKSKKPEKLVYLEAQHNHSSAAKREYTIKRLSRADKIVLIGSEQNQFA